MTKIINTMRDKNGKDIFSGMTVLVPEPDGTDIHNHEFEGTVIGFHGKYTQVEDQDQNVFAIEPERLEIID